MREYLPLLIVGAIIGVFSVGFIVAFVTMKDKKEAIGFDRHIPDKEIISRLLAYAFEQAPFGWIPPREVVDAAASVKKAYAGTGGSSEAFSCEFSARAAYLAQDIDAAIEDQTRAVSLFAGTEFLDEANQALSFYRNVKALKANP